MSFHSSSVISPCVVRYVCAFAIVVGVHELILINNPTQQRAIPPPEQHTCSEQALSSDPVVKMFASGGGIDLGCGRVCHRIEFVNDDSIDTIKTWHTTHGI